MGPGPICRGERIAAKMERIAVGRTQRRMLGVSRYVPMASPKICNRDFDNTDIMMRERASMTVCVKKDGGRNGTGTMPASPDANIASSATSVERASAARALTE